MGMFHLLLTKYKKEYWEEVSEKSGQPGMLEQLAQNLYSCTICCLLVFRISLFAKHKMVTREE